MLKEVIATTSGKARVPLNDEQRRRLAIAGKDLMAEERKEVCSLVKPAILLAWFWLARRLVMLCS